MIDKKQKAIDEFWRTIAAKINVIDYSELTQAINYMLTESPTFVIKAATAKFKKWNPKGD